MSDRTTAPVVYPAYDNLLAERRGTRLFITLNRPEARNAITHEMMRDIGAVLELAAVDDESRVVVLRGAGGNFSAGGDLNAMQNMPPAPPAGEPDPMVEHYRYFGDVLVELNRLPKPVIAVVEGGAAGGGFGMACCADVTIIQRDAKFALPEARVGFIPSQILPFIARRIGSGQLRRLVVLGERITAEDAFNLGVGHFLTDDRAATGRQLQHCLDLLDLCDPAAVRAAKAVVLASDTEPLLDVLDDAAARLVGLLRRPEAPAGMQAFLNKQPPPWAAEAQRLNSANGGD